MLKHGILGLLNYGSMTGYDIVQIFRDSLSYFWHAQTSQIYRELQTLKRNSWATDETIPQEGRPDKKIFTITDKGRDELKRWLREENAESEVRSPLMMKVFFRGELSLDENISFFKKLRNAGSSFTESLTTSPPDIANYASMIDDPMKALYWKMTVEYGKMYMKMQDQWIESCIRQMEELKNENPGD